MSGSLVNASPKFEKWNSQSCLINVGSTFMTTINDG